MEANSYVAVVEKVVPNGHHGPYAVASVEGLNGSITFSLEKPQWLEKSFPCPGTFVVLSDLQKKRAGWRAMHGRFMKPSDEKQSASRKEQRDEKKN